MVGDHEFKILKIKPWMIKFSFDGQRYFIKEEDCEEPIIVFYKFDCDNTGKYQTTYMDSHYGSLTWLNHIRGLTYRDYDKEYIINKLVEYGFNFGLSEDEFDYLSLWCQVDKIKRQIEHYQYEIRERCNKIMDLTTQENELMVKINEKDIQKA